MENIESCEICGNIKFEDAARTLTEEEKKYIMEARKIPAIRSLRERLEIGLREAKNIVDAYHKEKEGYRTLVLKIKDYQILWVKAMIEKIPGIEIDNSF